MPPSALNSHQKSLVNQFVQATGASERTAQRMLKSHNWKLAEAADAYFIGGGGAGGATTPPNNISQLEKLFETLRDDEDDPRDGLGAGSAMAYLQNQLKLNLESAELLVAFDIMQVETVGEITRKGYVDGWAATRVATVSHKAHSQYIKAATATLKNDDAYFKRVYRHTFYAGKEPGQKALDLENAIVYWGMLFTAPGRPWATKSHNWLQLWTTFLGEKWTRSVNRDMWNQTLEFATKTMQDETLSFWNEDGAWPSVIDDFVAWCREHGVAKAETMDVDQ